MCFATVRRHHDATCLHSSLGIDRQRLNSSSSSAIRP